MFIKKLSKNNQIGVIGEQLAQKLYVKRGYQIIETNFFNHRGKCVGEIDFIARSARSLAFVEVKTRTGKIHGGIEAISWHKQRKLLKAVRWYLASHREFLSLVPRIDVCVLRLGLDNSIKNVIIIPNAVEDGP